MNLYNKKDECCGCSACQNICSSNAINMKTDIQGFLYPKINEELCIECGICKKKCVFQNGYSTPNNFEIPHIYAVRHKNTEELLSSRSGGMFNSLIDYTLKNNGVVYGVGYRDKFKVVHKRATTKKECLEFKGSKYVQSEMNDIFFKVKEDLHNNKVVLFSGTPCQTSGLYSYLGNINLNKLIVCDIICHGTPSPLVWQDNIEYLEKKYNDSIDEVKFRDKKLGWNTHYESYKLIRKKKKVISRIFTDLFYKHIMLRPSCEKCIYTNFNRPSDFTLGDYWGWEKYFPDFNKDNNGISLLFINTQKGQKIFDLVKKDLFYYESSPNKCMQPNLKNPTNFSSLNESFWKDYNKYGFNYIRKKYSEQSIKRKIGLIIKSLKINYIK